MSALEIVLLLAGVVIFILSFMMPIGNGSFSEEAGELAKEEVKLLVAHEVDGAKKRIGDAADDAVDHAMDKTERALERISNEKIMAVNEYSDTVLKEINKNHEEVLFLYDMLNDKHTSLKNTVAKVSEVVKAVRETISDAEAATAAYRQEREGIEAAAGSFEQFKKQAEIATENLTRLKQEAENAMGSYKQLKGETEAVMSSLSQVKRETEATMRRFGQLNLEEAEATVSNFKQLKLEEAEAAVSNFNQINLAEAEAAMNSFKQLKEEAEAVMNSFKQLKEEAEWAAGGSPSPAKPQNNVNTNVPEINVPSEDMFDVNKLFGEMESAMEDSPVGIQQEESVADGFRSGLFGEAVEASAPKKSGFSVRSAQSGSRNEQILALHDQGKSTVAIAKELGLGVGEVKLVIDLYKNA